MNGIGGLALGGAWAHRGSLAGSALAIALAAALLTASGVLIGTGIAGGSGTGMLTALAGSFSGTVMMAAVMVVSSTVALSLRARQQDLSLLRAVGATRLQVRTMVAVELLAAVLLAAPVGGALGIAATSALRPLLRTAGLLPDGQPLALGPVPVLAAVAALVPLVGLAAVLSTRETLRTSPTQAVRRRDAEPRTIGRGRLAGSGVLGGLGLLSALSPLVVPGTVGAASAGASAFLLVGAAALAGPVLLGRTLRLLPVPSAPSAALALATARGLSRRLTSAVVPLVLVVAAGIVQTSLNLTVETAGRTQLAAALEGSLVLPGEPDMALLAQIPDLGVVSSLRSVPAEVRVEEEDVPGIDALSWTPAALGVYDAQLDPGVTDGSLEGLDRADTVAVSEDAALETGGVGSVVDIRYGELEVPTTVVAVYDRGLGIGDHLIGPATITEHGLAPHTEATLLRTGSADAAAVIASTGALAPEQYAASATPGDGSEQLSSVLLLALLAFVVIASANTLLMITGRRREEFRMLHRLGATRGLLLRMTLVEALLTGVLALVLGGLAALPALVGSTAGLLGRPVPVVDLAVAGALAVLVLVMPVLAMVPVAAHLTRPPRTGGPRAVLAAAAAPSTTPG